MQTILRGIFWTAVLEHGTFSLEGIPWMDEVLFEK